MLWFLLAVFVAITAAISVFIDNYVTDVCFKGRTPQAQKIIGIPALLLACIIIPIFFPLQTIEPYLALILIGTGILTAISFIAYYKALATEDATGATIFFQLAPIFYLIVGWTLLGEHITLVQVIAFALMVTAPLVVVFCYSKRSQRLKKRAVIFIILSLLLSVAANIIFVGVASGVGNSQSIDFLTAFFYVTLGRLIADTVFTILFRRWRVRFTNVCRTSRIKFIAPMIINNFLFIFSDLAFRLALVLGPVALVSAATNSMQLAITFFLGLILTIVWPRFGREQLRRKTILAHLTATGLVIAGIFLIG